MNIHKNARLTFARRLDMVHDVVERKLALSAAAAVHGVSVPTVRKWVGRYLAHGPAGLRDASSRLQLSPRAIAPATALAIVELRRRFLTRARTARSLRVSASTVGRVLRRAGLSRWSDLAPSEPVIRYEHALPGDLVHIDTKKLGRIERMSHRVTGNRRDTVGGAGWEYLFVAVDDHARLGSEPCRSARRRVAWQLRFPWLPSPRAVAPSMIAIAQSSRQQERNRMTCGTNTAQRSVNSLFMRM